MQNRAELYIINTEFAVDLEGNLRIMRIFRNIISIWAMLLLLSAPIPAKATELDTDTCAQQMIQYYLAYEDRAEAEIEVLLDQINDPWLEEMWRGILDGWAYSNYHMPVYYDVLPDGLPDNDSLCIVIMGFGLNPDGSMKPELIDRLKVGLASAEKYPNAYIAVTGGATSNVRGVTEAGQMAAWLRQKGVSKDRLILETGAYSTTENAINVHKILMRDYPSVTSIAVVTSDYHIKQSCAMFAAMNHKAVYADGARYLELVGNGVNYTGRKADTRYSQAWGISIITGIPFDKTPDVPPLFVSE